MTVKEIEALLDKAKREKYPNVPYLVKTKLKDNSANELTKSIVATIEALGGMATRVNSTGLYDPATKKFRKGTTKKGTADIHAVFQGRHLSIEVKFGKDKMSPEQHEMAAKVAAAGGLYIIARSLDQFLSDFCHEFNINP